MFSSLPRLPIGYEDPPPEDEAVTESEVDEMLRRETCAVNQQTENLLALLEDKKIQLEKLKELADDFRSSSDNE